MKIDFELGPRASFFVASILLLVLWRVLRFTILPLLWPDEPKTLPYWIPCERYHHSMKSEDLLTFSSRLWWVGKLFDNVSSLQTYMTRICDTVLPKFSCGSDTRIVSQSQKGATGKILVS